MAKVEMLKLDIGISTEDVIARQKKLEDNGYLLVSQSGYTMFYESTDGIDKEYVIEQHKQYMKLLESMDIKC